jgi:hypothetical protein
MSARSPLADDEGRRRARSTLPKGRYVDARAGLLWRGAIAA